jgi:hypothetical protein
LVKTQEGPAKRYCCGYAHLLVRVVQRISSQEAASLNRQPFLCLDKLLPRHGPVLGNGELRPPLL